MLWRISCFEIIKLFLKTKANKETESKVGHKWRGYINKRSVKLLLKCLLEYLKYLRWLLTGNLVQRLCQDVWDRQGADDPEEPDLVTEVDLRGAGDVW